MLSRRARGVCHRNEHFAPAWETWFCEEGLAELGVDPARGLVVNATVPLKITG